MRNAESVFGQAIKAALAHHQAGRLAEAERIYQRVLQEDPNEPDALHLLGVIAHQAGKNEIALQLIERAIRVQPTNPGFLNHRGLVLHALDRYHEALGSYDMALAARPDYAEALNNRGAALRKLKRYDEALVTYDKALRIRPDHAEALNNRGAALQVLDRHEEALASYDKALAIRPAYAEALLNRANTLQQDGRYDEALACYNKALAIKPDFADALTSRGNALQRMKRYEDALSSYDRTLAIKPSDAAALLNRGGCLLALHRYDEALAEYDKALKTRTDFAEALLSRGAALQALNRHEEALASYSQALAIRPDYAEAHFNESLCRLGIGDFERGWEKYEWRWKWADFPSPRRTFSQPPWLGNEDLAGKTILLHAEQGLGDTIQFCRYAEAVAQKGARVILEVQPRLRLLLSDVPGVSQVLSRGEPLPGFDFHCPLLSMPLAFKTRLESVPATVPYLRTNAADVTKWERRLSKKNAPRVGIVWSGRAAEPHLPHRSIALSGLVPLAATGLTLVSLQKEVRDEDRKILDASTLVHFGPELNDFSDTAALVALMDLVISVDTSVAHLAGALGKPVWILLPFTADWRWLVQRHDSPWYPTARLFRQPAIGDWDSVIKTVTQQLREWLHPRSVRQT